MTVAISSNMPTLLDQVRRMDPDGSQARIVEMLQASNPILQDAVALEGNLPTGHRTTIRSGLPAVGWRLFNSGVAPSKSTTIQVDETCGMLEGYSMVDCDLAQLNGNEAAFRSSEDRAFIQAMNNEVMRALFYENTRTAPEKIHGFSPRFASKANVEYSSQVIPYIASPTGAHNEQSSMWFITWGPDTCHLIYPKGMVGGLQSEDLGKQIVTSVGTAGSESARTLYTAWVTRWAWKIGLCIRDWRYVARIGNIDSSDILKTGTGLREAMIQAFYQIQDPNMGRLVIYCNRLVGQYLHLHAMNAATSGLTLTDWHGKQVTSFLGVPIVTCDGLIQTEAVLGA
jgi:hypothetical protein